MPSSQRSLAIVARPPPEDAPVQALAVDLHARKLGAEQLQSTLDIVLRRFAEYHNPEGAFARRATIERAKGILMAVHGIEERQAFEMLRSHSQRTGRRLLDLAEAVVDGHRLLAPPLDR